MMIALFSEVGLSISTVIIFQEELTTWRVLWWVCSSMPLFINSITKTWFLVLILIVQQRLCAINNHLSEIKQMFAERNSDNANFSKKNHFVISTVGYLADEIHHARKVNKVQKFDDFKTLKGTRKLENVNIFPIKVSPESKCS
jgi:hypothetical protein